MFWSNQIEHGQRIHHSVIPSVCRSHFSVSSSMLWPQFVINSNPFKMDHVMEGPLCSWKRSQHDFSVSTVPGSPPKWHQLEQHNYMLSRCILSRVCLKRPKPLISIRGCLFLVVRILQTIKNITIGYVHNSINWAALATNKCSLNSR